MTTNWGIVGTGYISTHFASCLKQVDGAVCAAVASRDSLERAQQFASKHHFGSAYGSYPEMAQDRSLDIIYIGTPHPNHFETVMLFLDAGFNVVCEKPMGVNARQVSMMVQKAKEKNVFLMEGMWTRFFPAVQKALEWIRTGRIGEPVSLFCNFGIDASDNLDQWRFKQDMAGGALLDVGIYPLAMAFAVFGTQPDTVQSQACIRNGVDQYETITLGYKDHRFAVLGAGLTVRLENKVVINGTAGTIIIGDDYDWWRAKSAKLLKPNDSSFGFAPVVEIFESDYPDFGFQYEAAAVQDYVQRGYKEAPEIALVESFQIAQTMDALRKQWQVRYLDD